ncbi:inositol monophosphatase family protein [Nocardioides convexus]|uniref:inositol monophosphatase family protein n=1 Tax=Nocardioides convexus TaxID=2712224 RepID=UPI002418284E|nr:inositol monophosphatase family protein [Nocardioides convexus]
MLSEEALESAADKDARLSADKVWIVDPLDGTREFSEPPRDDWAVHVALWQAGQPGRRRGGPARAWGRPSAPVCRPSYPRARRAVRGSPSRAPARRPSWRRWRRSLDAGLVPMGSAGVKMMSVVRDVADAYVHAGGQYEWDSAAPVAVARAAGLFTSRVDGSEPGLQPGRRLPARRHRVPPRVCRSGSWPSSRRTARTEAGHGVVRLAHHRGLHQRLRASPSGGSPCWGTSTSTATRTCPATSSA